MNERKAFKKRIGNHSVTIGPYLHPVTRKEMWRFGYRLSPDSNRKQTTRTRLKDIESEAERILNLLNADELDWQALTQDRRVYLKKIHEATPLSASSQDAILDLIGRCTVPI